MLKKKNKQKYGNDRRRNSPSPPTVDGLFFTDDAQSNPLFTDDAQTTQLKTKD